MRRIVAVLLLVVAGVGMLGIGTVPRGASAQEGTPAAGARH
jgi:hypothetical protein